MAPVDRRRPATAATAVEVGSAVRECSVVLEMIDNWPVLKLLVVGPGSTEPKALPACVAAAWLLLPARRPVEPEPRSELTIILLAAPVRRLRDLLEVMGRRGALLLPATLLVWMRSTGLQGALRLADVLPPVERSTEPVANELAALPERVMELDVELQRCLGAAAAVACAVAEEPGDEKPADLGAVSQAEELKPDDLAMEVCAGQERNSSDRGADGDAGRVH